MEDFSLDDYIIKKGFSIGSKPGVRARIGFKQQATVATKPSAVTSFGPQGARQGFGSRLGFKQQTPFIRPTKTFGGVQLNFNTLGQPAKPEFTKMFDARQRLSTGKQLTTMPDARQKLLQKSKFSDARQRLDMKKQQQQKETATDMRMKILAKRRLNSTTDNAASRQCLVPESVQVTVPGQGLLGAAPQQYLQDNGSVQSRLIGQSKPIVVATGRGQFAIRPAPSAGTVTVIGGSLKKTIPASFPVVQSSSSATQLSQFTADKLRITAHNEHALLNRLPLTTNMSSVSAGTSAFHLNTLRAATNVAAAAQNIETIISSRSERTASAAEAAAAKVAVQAAAAAAIRPTVNRNTATADTTAQGESTSNGIVSPLQGYRTLITNLQTTVTLDDIMELFGDIGAMKNARVVKPGLADVVFVNQRDAVTAYKTYNMRELDGRPMSIQLMFEPEPFSVLSKPCACIELDIDVMQRALFKSVADATPRIPVNFTVQL